MTTPSVILVEFNELCPPLIERFMSAGRLPNFSRFFAESQVYRTEADEGPPHLEPWIQWITVHTGLPYRQHQIYNLGEGHKVGAKAIWDVLVDAGLTVWVCGSMNIRYDRPIRGAVLPDPWTTQIPVEPPALEPYFRFISKSVVEYTNEKVPLGARDVAAFVGFMARHGLRAETALAIARQLASERRSKTHWRRATILDRLQMDVFRHYHRKLKPHFATFFSNSTAHFQHMYWRNLEPDLFKVKPTAAEQAELAEAIPYGYESMDRMLGDFFALAGEDTTLIFCTALSQQPCLLYEDQGGKVFFRPRDFDALLRWCGIEGRHSISPVMSHYFHVHCAGEREAAAAADLLRALEVDGTQAIHVDVNGSVLFCGCRIYRALGASTRLRSARTGRETPFFELFYPSESLKSGMHHPDGMLWIRRPDRAHRVHEGKLPLTQVAPMILDLFPVARPESMQAAPLAS